MNSLFMTAITSGKLWDFRGGIHPPDMKSQTCRIPIGQLPLADYFILPLQQHLGSEGDLLVNIGNRVLKGQPLTSGKNRALPIHAPTSGIVTDIGLYTTAHPSGLTERCIYLTADGEDTWRERRPYDNYQNASVEELVEKIHQAGIAGLGGAGFPTAAKLSGGLTKIKALIINGAECEPYITSDDRLMQEHADEIIKGIEILRYILKPTLTIIGIEDNKPEAISALNAALNNDPHIILRVIPTKYPSGGARQLTKILTGSEVPYGKHSSAIGVLMQNVSTVYAVKRAIIDDEPLIERIVTLTGEGLNLKGNIRVPLGTPVGHLLKHSNYQSGPTKNTVIMGGSLMGFMLPHDNVPVVKTTNCILIPSPQELTANTREQSCIRCGQCADVCPSGLLPQQLYWFSRGKEHEKARDYHLFDCIECGSCAYVCPSHIPLVQYYRQEKAEIKELDNNALLAQQAKQRFEAKQARLEQEKRARQQRHNQAAVGITNEQNDEIQAALMRVKAKQNMMQPQTELTIKAIKGSQLPDNSHIAAAREARKAQARQNRLQKTAGIKADALTDNIQKHSGLNGPYSSQATKTVIVQNTVDETIKTTKSTDAEISTVTPETDPRKAAVAAAIARAKARKENQQQAQTTDTIKQAPTVVSSSQPENDARKAAVAAAIERAKARKESQRQNPVQPSENNDNAELISPPALPEQDARKAAVAQAIARAQLRKAQLKTPALNKVDK